MILGSAVLFVHCRETQLVMAKVNAALSWNLQGVQLTVPEQEKTLTDCISPPKIYKTLHMHQLKSTTQQNSKMGKDN